MTFSIIDQKGDCQNIYVNGQVITNPDFGENKYTQTWAYNSRLSQNNNIEYANLYCLTNNIDKICPGEYKQSWEGIKQKHNKFIKSFRTAKVKFNDFCFYDLVPETFVKEYFELKNKITDSVFENYEKPQYYDFLVDLSALLSKVEQQELNIDLSVLKDRTHQFKTRQFIKKIKRTKNHIHYDIFGTITGRLSTKKHSFPILTMDKDYRDILKPRNDLFVELDFNAAELRTVLSLNEKEQPQNDIHRWHANIMKKVYGEELSREEIKKKIFSWLYNPSADSIGIKAIEEAYDKKTILDKYWDGEYVKTSYGRKIKADHHHAFNFIVQSTTSDTFLRRVINLDKMLENKKSFICWTIHDSCCIDLSLEDKKLIPELVNVFENTDLGRYKVNLKVGKDFKNMRGL